MDPKLIDAYLLIDKAFSTGIIDDEEVLEILKEILSFNEVGAVAALASYYDHKKEIKDYIKKNNLTSDKKPIQLGEE